MSSNGNISQHRRSTRDGGPGRDPVRLRPIDPKGRLLIRRQDLQVFEAAARNFDHTIIVRASNEHSLQFIGRRGYSPKPIDCKPKTADRSAYLARLGLQIQCQGLVVDPGIVGDQAFANGERRRAAREAWARFLRDKSPEEAAHKIFLRRGASSGYFAVDLDLTSPHYGCLMFSDSALPACALAAGAPRGLALRAREMNYIHSDYDLYGLLDMHQTGSALVEDTGEAGFHQRVVSGELYGVPHYYTESFPAIQAFLNRGFGAPLIQHGSQDSVTHLGDLLYVFDPLGGMFFVDATAEAMGEIYRLIFRQARKPR